MEQPKCSCAQFERLEGASVNAYIKAFLEQPEGATTEAKHLYRCRVCGSEWEKRAPESDSAGTRPSLVRAGGSRQESLKP
ncbi:MAG TPA: hypothetical protein VGC89_02555 [Pyrinomonadaceae bacterium]